MSCFVLDSQHECFLTQRVGETFKEGGGVRLFYFPAVRLSYCSSYLAKQPLILFEVQPELRDCCACPLKIAGVTVASCVLDCKLFCNI